MELIELILKSNLFNFIIMVAIIAHIAKKCNVSQKLDDAVSKVKELIENSELAKLNSIEELKESSEKTKNIEAEIDEIEQQGQENLSNMEEKITLDSEKQIQSIKKNADRILDGKEKEVVLKLSKKTVLASLELAKQHIINLLNQNPEYHKKFIKESIEELNRLK